jgi:hypothetical protein
MSEVKLDKPALSGTGKPRRLFDKGTLFALGGLGILCAILGLSDNSTVEDFASGKWANKCVTYDGHGGYVTEVKPDGKHATVRRTGSSTVIDSVPILDSVPITELTAIDCYVVLPPLANTETPAEEVSVELEQAAERQKEIVRLKSDIQIMKLRLDLARVSNAYHAVVTGGGTASSGDLRSQDTAGEEIDANKRRLDDLKAQIERSKVANDYYNRLNAEHGTTDLQRNGPHGPPH